MARKAPHRLPRALLLIPTLVALVFFAAAGAMLGGQSVGITSQIAQALGVDEFSLRQAPDGDTRDTLASQILTVGKRLSDRAWLGYEQGLTAATSALKFTYALTPRISLVTRAGGIMRRTCSTTSASIERQEITPCNSD